MVKQARVLVARAGRIVSFVTGSERVSLRPELRSYCLTGLGTNKIVRSNSATPYSIESSKMNFSHTHGASNMIRYKVAAMAVALSAFAAQPAFSQAAIQEPGAFEFYHPNEDVLNAGAPTLSAALASTLLARNAYAAIGDTSTATRNVGKTICRREPQVGAFAIQPWSNGSPCTPAGY
jgi:hypothetical protein